MKVDINIIATAMEKLGYLSFDSGEEKDGFVKIAQGAIDPMLAQMAAQQANMPAMTDPATIQMEAAQADPAAAVGPEPGVQPLASTEETMVGESISNADIESLIKVVNVLSSLKSKYDAMKSEQAELFKQQTSGEPIPTGA